MAGLIDLVPVLNPIITLDSSKGKSVYYKYTGSKMAVANELRIKRLDTDEFVYSYTYDSMEKVHHIPPNILVNGIVYEAEIRLRLQDGTFTNYSSKQKFKALTTPILDIVSIDGQGFVYNSDVTFVATYTQAEDEKIESYRWYLYDENNMLTMSFPLKTYSDYITQDIKDLEKGKVYYVECKIETVNGVTHRIKERFTPLYVTPTPSGDILAEMNNNTGFSNVQAILKQVVANGVYAKDRDGNNLDISKYQYVDGNRAVSLKNNDIVSYMDLGINGSFISKIFFKNVGTYDTFAEFKSANGNFKYELLKYPNYVQCIIRKNGSVLARVQSNSYVFDSNYAMVTLLVKDNDVSITLQRGTV